MIEAASLGLANSLTDEERGLELIYPRIERIRDISAQIALSVIRAAQKAVREFMSLITNLFADVARQNVDRSPHLRQLDDSALVKHIMGKMWNPQDTMSHL